jgi:hypothetical protein|tara:strand:+ start:590 stop:925 length:336 start_codon:yes stop_codon:yes gene_type:complete
MFGYERTIETVREGCAEGISAEALVERLMSKAREFAGEEPQADEHDLCSGEGGGLMANPEPLDRGSLHRFADWPNEVIPRVAAGVYTVWQGDRFLYVGMAGRKRSAVRVVT